MHRLVFVVALAVVAAPLAAQGSIELSVPLAELQHRVIADSNDPAAHYNVALGYWNAKKWPEVERELRAAIALEPRFAAAHLALGFEAMARDPDLWKSPRDDKGHYPKALTEAISQFNSEYRHAFLIDPMVDLRIMATVSRSTDSWMVSDYLSSALGQFIRGIEECYEGKYDGCEVDMSAFILSFGNSKYNHKYVPSTAYFLGGLAAAHMKHYDAAIADFSTLMDLDSAAVAKAEEKNLVRVPIRSNEHRYFIAMFNHAAGRDDEAIRLYQEAIEKDLSLYIAHVRLADIYEARRDFDHAIAERHDAMNANPDDASLGVDLGITLGRAGKFPEAAEVLHHATDAMPRNFDAWYWLGIADQQLGQKADAAAAFQRVIALAPSRMADRVAQAKQHLASLQ